MTFYITKNALTSGIKKRDDLKEGDDGRAYGKPGWETYRIGIGCFRTYEEAKRDAESKVERKIELLRKQIESLKKLNFPEPE
jgi:hypothetical protein